MEEPTLSQAVLSEVLAQAGLPRAEVDSMLAELMEQAGRKSDAWTADDCALAVLRSIAPPSIEPETFLAFWACAPLSVVTVTEEGHEAWSMMGDALNDSPFAHFKGQTLWDALSEHLRAIGNGHAARSDYPDILSLDASCRTNEDPTAVIGAHFTPPAFKRNTLVKFVFGDAWAFHQGKRGIIGNFPVAVLDEIGMELRRSNSFTAIGFAYVQSGRDEPVRRVVPENGATLH